MTPSRQEAVMTPNRGRVEVDSRVKPVLSVENEKENDRNVVNETSLERKESADQGVEPVPFIKRCDSKVIYSKFQCKPSVYYDFLIAFFI